MPNSKFSTNFQLNISIFEARASHRGTLDIEAIGQKVGPGRECSKVPSISGGLVLHGFFFPKNDNCATKWVFYPNFLHFTLTVWLHKRVTF